MKKNEIAATCAVTDDELDELRKHADEATALLKALSNSNRLLILCTLTGGEMSVSELHAKFGLSQSALSQQLAILRNEGLVQTRRQSQSIYYSLAPSKSLRIIETLKNLYCSNV